jgi:hypothetical protein
MLPDQAKRTEGLAILADRCSALVMVEDGSLRIIGTADIIDDPVIRWRDPLWVAAPHDLRLREKPGEDDAGQQFISVEAAGMRDEKSRDHENMP